MRKVSGSLCLQNWHKLSDHCSRYVGIMRGIPSRYQILFFKRPLQSRSSFFPACGNFQILSVSSSLPSQALNMPYIHAFHAKPKRMSNPPWPPSAPPQVLIRRITTEQRGPQGDVTKKRNFEIRLFKVIQKPGQNNYSTTTSTTHF